MKNRSEINFKNKNNFFRKHPLLKMGMPVILIISMFVLLSLSNAVGHSSAGDITTENKPEKVFAKNFGGSDSDWFNSVIEVSGGYIAVGDSASASFGHGNWIGVSGKGDNDAIIVKFDTSGKVIWAKNFGGSGYDEFFGVTSDSDGYIAVGESTQDSFGNGNWTGNEGNGGNEAIIVKFDTGGNVIWAKNFGGSGNDEFTNVSADSSGFIAVGDSSQDSFGSGDWTGIEGNGIQDSVVVKYDTNGNQLWKKNYGDGDIEELHSVTSDSSGYIAVGMSISSGSGASGNVIYAIIMKIDTNGDLIWKKTLGEGYLDNYFSVISDSSGYIVVGGSLDKGDSSVLNVKGNASIVKFDIDGNVMWKKTFGGGVLDTLFSVTADGDGYVAAGVSGSGSFGNGDWTGVSGKGDNDAIIVKFDTNGDVVWKENFGGKGLDSFESVISVSNGYVAVGNSGSASFGNGDWRGVAGKGNVDGFLVEFGNNPGSQDSSSQNTILWAGIVAVIIIICAAVAYFVYRRGKNNSSK